jgi:hypothetical protein
MADDELPDLVGKLAELGRSRRALNWSVYAILGLWVLSAAVAVAVGPAAAGLVGDSFGALNTLFSGLAMLGVFYAVLLQRQEIDLTRKDAKAAGKARRKSDRLLRRQAEALLVGAQLNAANALLVAPPGALARDIPVSADGDVKYKNLKEVMNQYIKILMHQITSPERGPGEEVPQGGSVFRQYMIDLYRDALARLDAVRPEGRWVLARSLVFDLKDEMWLILAHDGVAGGPDAELAVNGIRTLGNLGITGRRDEDPRDEVQIYRDVRAALSSLHVAAKSRRV